MENGHSNRKLANLNLQSRTSPFRPLSVTLLAFGVLIIAGINWIRIWQAIRQWQFIAELYPALPYYQAFSGFVWSLVGFPLAWGLWRGSKRAYHWIRWAALAYTIYLWLDRLLLRKGLELANLPFSLAANALLLVSVFWVVSRSRVRTYFQQR
jgi:hypothetical protein